eukprot:1184619-Prorocentrum_minimum.AAC.1
MYVCFQGDEGDAGNTRNGERVAYRSNLVRKRFLFFCFAFPLARTSEGNAPGAGQQVFHGVFPMFSKVEPQHLVRQDLERECTQTKLSQTTGFG